MNGLTGRNTGSNEVELIGSKRGIATLVSFILLLCLGVSAKKNFALCKLDGGWAKNETEVKNEILGYYKELFQFHDGTGVEEVLENITPMVTLEQNATLMAEVSVLEIREVVFAMGPHKAPGLDGYNSHFFQVHWDVIRHDVVGAVQQFFRTGKLFQEFNRTFIAQIPKVPQPQVVTQFRPISLCNLCAKLLLRSLQID